MANKVGSSYNESNIIIVQRIWSRLCLGHNTVLSSFLLQISHIACVAVVWHYRAVEYMYRPIPRRKDCTCHHFYWTIVRVPLIAGIGSYSTVLTSTVFGCKGHSKILIGHKFECSIRLYYATVETWINGLQVLKIDNIHIYKRIFYNIIITAF